ncbi:MAG: class II aldolase/adducin family protein [Nanoarchaeota archaeon]
MKSLDGKVLYIIGTGAKKITQIPRMIQEFVGEGAEIYTMMSDIGKQICDSGLSEFRINRNTIIQGYSGEGEALPLEDMVLVAPCTFNTLNKIAGGIADTYPLTIAATAIGAGRNVVIAPAMNGDLWYHPIMQESRKKLEQWGCKIVWPEITPEKVTMAPIEKIADTVYHILSGTRYDSEQVERTIDFDRLVDNHYTEFREVGQELVDIDLTRGTGGCLSKKVNEGILVSASGSQVGSLSKQDISLIIKVENEKIHWMGYKKPSSESPLLSELYQNFSEANAIIHSHCPRITYDSKMQKYSIPNYVRAGCFGEGKKIANVISDNEGFAILRLHGELAVGSSLQEVYQKLKTKMEEAHER